MDTEDEKIRLAFAEFLKTADEWERTAVPRVIEAEADCSELWELLTTELKTALAPYCTVRCLQRIPRLRTVQSPSRYGLRGGTVTDCRVQGLRARITTKGLNKLPECDWQRVYLLVLEDGRWKIDSKKEISDSGRERKVDLF